MMRSNQSGLQPLLLVMSLILCLLVLACSQDPPKVSAQNTGPAPEPVPDVEPATDIEPELDVAEVETTDPELPLNLPPAWPADAVLTAIEASPGVVRLTWPYATDNSAVQTYKVYRDEVLIRQLPASVTSALVEGPPAGIPASFRVEAIDDVGAESIDGPQASFMPPDPTAPMWPSGSALTASELSPTGLVLGWPMATDNVAVTGYRVEQDGQELAFLEADARSLAVDSLSPWIDYSFSVVALDAAGNKTPPLLRSIQTLDDQAPVWPDDGVLTVGEVTPTSALLSWPAATDDVAVVGYRVLRNLVIVATTDAETTTVLLSALLPQEDVTVCVEAVDAAGNVSSGGPKATFNTGDDSVPTWSENAVLVASQLTENTLSLGWTPAEDNVAVTAYKVQKDGEDLAVTDGSITWLAVTGLNPWQTYSFTVKAEDALGNTTAQELSTTVQTPDTTLPLWPAGSLLNASDVSADTVTLDWSSPTDNVGIEVVNLYRDNVLLAALTAADTEYTDTGLSPWTSYIYRVEALDVAQNLAANSPTITVQTPDASAPAWPTSSMLVANNIQPTSLTLTWPQPVDDVEVVQFRVFLDTQELATVEGSVRTLDVTELSPWTAYNFRVEAVDSAGNWSSTGPTLSVKTTDTSPPAWPDGGGLEVLNLVSTSLTLVWPSATDDVAIAGYTVRIDGVILSTVAGDVTSMNVVNLAPWTSYNFQVTAVDPAGNMTEVPLSTGIETPDGGPPVWPDDATLGIGALGPKSVQLLWSVATDDVAVTGYRVYQDSLLIQTVSDIQATISGLAPETGYSFRVEAGDGAGNWSSDGPSVSLTTGSDLWKNETVYELMRPTCVGCHESGNAPFFASLEAFENGLAHNSALVIGGNPDASELVKLLEGTSLGGYGKMPLGESFVQKEAKGETLIGIEDIRKWIQYLVPPVLDDVPEPVGVLNERKRVEQMSRNLYDQLGLDLSDFFFVSTYLPSEVPCLATDFTKNDTYALVSPDAHFIRCDSPGVILTAEDYNIWLGLGGPHWRKRVQRTQSITPGVLLRLTQVAQDHCRKAILKEGNDAVLKYASLAHTSADNAEQIRENIAYLHLRLLGEVATTEQVDALFELFQAYESGVVEGIAFEQLTVAGWTAVCSSLIRSPLWLTY